MASKNISIINKKSSVPGKIPAAADLELGELAINIHDGDVYIKKSDDSVIKVGDDGLDNWTEVDGHILPNANDTYDIGSSVFKIRDLYMSGSTIHLGTQSISADADGIKMPSIKIGTGGNEISLTASSTGKLIQTAKVGGVTQTPVTYTIDGLDDTDISNLVAGNILSYDVGSSKWVNSVPIDAYTKTEVDNLDAVITTNLATEVTDRTAADTVLTTNLATEVTDRTSADLILGGNLASEVSDRTAADTLLTTNLSTETTNRIAGDTALTTNLATEVSDRTAADLLKADKSDTYTKSQVDTNISAIVDSAPGTLNTLNELAAALGDDANHVTTMTTLIGTKADQSTTYTKDEVNSAIGGIPDTDLTSYDTSAQVDTKLLTKSDTTHSHDGNYYLKGQVDTNITTAISNIPESSSVKISETPPATPSDGDLWVDSTTMRMYIHYVDSDSAQWVEVVSGSGVQPVSGSASGGGTYTAGVIWDNHDSTRTEYDESLSVVSGATLALTHDADTEELRSVYIEKSVDVTEVGPTPVSTMTIPEMSVVGMSTVNYTTYNLAGTYSDLNTGFNTNTFHSGDLIYFYPNWSGGSNPNQYINFTVVDHCHLYRIGDADWGGNGWNGQLEIYNNAGVLVDPGLIMTTDINTWQLASGVLQPGDYIIKYVVGTSTYGAVDNGWAFVPYTPPQPSYTYWQLESFDDWGVQFTDSTTTTLINNTGADATIRARLTKPTALASTSGTTSGGLSVYLTPLALPTTGSTGDQAYVESNTSLYIYDENITGWYRVALINQTPTFTSTPDASYVFAKDGTPIVVTPVAVDPEGSLVTYSVIGDTGTVATMTQDGNAFTLTPSTDTANAGSFSITFRATDGTNVTDAISNFNLSFAIEYIVFSPTSQTTSTNFYNGLNLYMSDFINDGDSGSIVIAGNKPQNYGQITLGLTTFNSVGDIPSSWAISANNNTLSGNGIQWYVEFTDYSGYGPDLWRAFHPYTYGVYSALKRCRFTWVRNGATLTLTCNDVDDDPNNAISAELIARSITLSSSTTPIKLIISTVPTDGVYGSYEVISMSPPGIFS